MSALPLSRVEVSAPQNLGKGEGVGPSGARSPVPSPWLNPAQLETGSATTPSAFAFRRIESALKDVERLSSFQPAILVYVPPARPGSAGAQCHPDSTCLRLSRLPLTRTPGSYAGASRPYWGSTARRAASWRTAFYCVCSNTAPA